jgi:hypothetical protein
MRSMSAGVKQEEWDYSIRIKVLQMETIHSSQSVYIETYLGAQLGVLLYNGAFQTLHGRFTHNRHVTTMWRG